MEMRRCLIYERNPKEGATMKKISVIIAIMLTAVLLCTAFVGCTNKDKDADKTYVSMDINPSVNLVIDGEGKVEAVEAANEDAQVMLYGEVLVGKTAEEAFELIANLAIECGYLTEENSGVNVTVVAGNGSAEAEANVGETVKAAFNAEAGKADLKVNINTGASFSLQRQFEYIKGKYPNVNAIQNMSIGKFKLVTELVANDDGVTFEYAATLDNEDLIEKLNNCYEKIEPYATEAYNLAVAQANEAFEIAKTTAEGVAWTAYYTKLMATNIFEHKVNYGAIYAAYDIAAVSVDYTLDVIELTMEYADKALSNVDTQKIADILGVEKSEVDAAVTDENGNITLESLEAYIDRTLKNMSVEAYNQIKAELPELETYINGFQAEVDEYINSLPEKYATQIRKILADIKDLGSDVFEFVDSLGDLTIDDVRTVVTYLEGKRDETMQKIEEDLTAEELEEAKTYVQASNDIVSSAQTIYNTAVESAKKDAEEFLAQAKEARFQWKYQNGNGAADAE